MVDKLQEPGLMPIHAAEYWACILGANLSTAAVHSVLACRLGQAVCTDPVKKKPKCCRACWKEFPHPPTAL